MKVIICGAGIAGLALAERLHTLGAAVVVVEKAPGPRTQGYMIDFFGPGYDAAEAMGVLPRIRELGHHVEEMTYRDRHGRRRAGMRFARFAKIVDGRLISIMRPDLERALRDHVPAGVEIRHATTVTGIDNRADGVTVTLTGGTTIDADLLVGADGIHSTVRDQTFGPERRFLRYLGFHTAAYSFDDAGVHAQVAGQFCLTDTVDRQMGFYGLRGERVAVFTVHRTADPSLPADPRAAIRREYGTLGWVAPRALAACPPPEHVYYDQVAQIDMPAWTRDRVTLIGDAAHAVSLLAGQGASLGITGAYVLAEHLSHAKTIETALDGYERTLRPVVTDKQQVARNGTRWFIPATTTQLHIRRAALKLARVPVIDRYVAAALAGKSTGIIDRPLGPASPATT
ncbi:FAD-dependent monooxygenase [Actinoallomurus iriomotensis]|uniref:FAD-dependent oxidoreductase n=1 Tax=Actinoallomurus iriomotensis TaxID=478107 RepID=A0A9W6RID3_9ACTN|nr:FAD-dependent monooxygenase [Actinoallomurus iriomotensis]GLY76273.1 FAD-dependent oxidoreductase [Actinoallomurus iriomotensis]